MDGLPPLPPTFLTTLCSSIIFFLRVKEVLPNWEELIPLPAFINLITSNLIIILLALSDLRKQTLIHRLFPEYHGLKNVGIDVWGVLERKPTYLLVRHWRDPNNVTGTGEQNKDLCRSPKTFAMSTDIKQKAPMSTGREKSGASCHDVASPVPKTTCSCLYFQYKQKYSCRRNLSQSRLFSQTTIST